jgi:erythromycin esterase-like protein
MTGTARRALGERLRLIGLAVVSVSSGFASQAGCVVQEPGASLAESASPLNGADSDYDPLLADIGDARFVLLGESSHGTHEFYVERARISERLIRETGFRAIVIEGDWPEIERVNRYVRGEGADATGDEALSDFEDFPEWMWRNTAFRDLIERLRAWNLTQPAEGRAGVYGMDVYALFEAADAVVDHLEDSEPAAAERARRNYRCFAPYRRDTAAYGAAARRPARSCEDEAAAVAAELRSLPPVADPEAAEARFGAIRHAGTVVGGEAYFRAAYAGAYAWNARDRAMTSAITETADHVRAQAGAPGRVIVWAHNTHVGDARATDAAYRGEVNLGQLLREAGESVYGVGFLTSGGQVRAATAWGRPGRVFDVRPPLPGSDAALLRAAGLTRALLLLRHGEPAAVLSEPRPQRAIGVIYIPDQERSAHYLEAAAARQFDALIYLDATTAVEPLSR